MDYQLDLRCYHCPLPLLMTKRAVAMLNQGDRLWLKVNAQTSFNDFVALANCHYLRLSQVEPTYWQIDKS